MQSSCPKTCGKCGSPSPSPPPPSGGGGGSGCSDTSGPAGWTCGGKQCQCKDVKSYCNDKDWGEAVRSGCPKTCGACGGRPVPSPSPGGGGGCRDSSAPAGWKCGGKQCQCNQVRSYCNNKDYGEAVRSGCPKTCGVCGGRPVPSPSPGGGGGCRDSSAPAGWKCG